ncbi:testis development-related protein-like [Sinocyclocheilus rhinocerous]|uniref:testis development-related protein-like n=1 Tax=Sinocyclocheilus rhinocerous TaxID=307959 RepID=UPI0007B89F63|nr:PREDICTED: testis development-related protein-like [Sinocyclocheilus rhinocerous]
MFKKSKSKVLVDEASEEDDVAWHHEHARKDKDSEGTEEVLSPSTKDSKLKKVKSKREKGDKKLFPSQDDEHILLTGVTVSHRRGSAKKNWEDDKSKAHPEKDKAHCLWDSISMTMKQITPTRKIDKIEGWEPPQLNDGMEEEKNEPEKKRSDSSPLSSPLSLSLPHSLGLPSWVGLGSEEDSSRYSSLTESQTGGPAQWAARARDKLAAVRRRSPASLSESNWEGLK